MEYQSKYMFHRLLGQQRINSQEEEDALGPGWLDHPPSEEEHSTAMGVTETGDDVDTDGDDAGGEDDAEYDGEDHEGDAAGTTDDAGVEKKQTPRRKRRHR